MHVVSLNRLFWFYTHTYTHTHRHVGETTACFTISHPILSCSMASIFSARAITLFIISFSSSVRSGPGPGPGCMVQLPLSAKHILQLRLHCFYDLTKSSHTRHCFLNSYRADIHDADKRDGEGVCLLTALYRCVTDHTSEGCRWNKREDSVRLVDSWKRITIFKRSDSRAYPACMLLCLSLDAQRSELLLITVSVMLHYAQSAAGQERQTEMNSAWNSQTILNCCHGKMPTPY